MSDNTINLVEHLSKSNLVTSKPVRKRKDGGSELPNKRPKANDADTPEFDTKITDVIDDCLQLIFEHLKFKDLSCVAIAHQQLKEAAGMVFGRKYGKKEIRLMLDGITVLKDDNYMRSVYGGFSVKKLSYYGEFLQNLGDRISKLNIGLNNALYKTVEPALLEKCVESLVELTVHEPLLGRSKLRDVFGSIKEPFPNVMKLCLNRCHLNERASQLNIWFPKLQSLTLFDSIFADPELIVAKYPLLEHFSVGGWKEANTLTKPHIYEILRLNPQIRSLDIGLSADGNEFKFYQRINKILPKLEKLNLCWEKNSFKYYDGTIKFKHIKSLVLDFSFHSFSGARYLPFVFDQLTELEINNIPLLTNEWLHFIVQNKSLTKLSVLPINENYFDRPNNQDFMQIGKKLHNLKTLTIDATDISTRCLLQFMSMRTSLTELRLHWNDCFAFNSFHDDLTTNGPSIFASIQDKWHIPSMINSPVTFKRKIN